MPELCFGAIARLQQGSQHDGLNHIELGTFANLLQRLGVHLWRRLQPLHPNPVDRKKLDHPWHLFRVWALMNSKQRRELVLFQKTRSADIRCDHAFLNQQMGFVTLVRMDVFNLALFIVFEHNLLGIKLDGMTTFACDRRT